MNKQSGLYLLLKVVFILIFLPFFLIWFFWKKTSWSKTGKWLATVGIIVVFFVFPFANADNTNQLKNKDLENKVSLLQEKVDDLEKNKDVETTQIKSESVQTSVGEAIKPQEEIFKIVNVVDGDTVKLDSGQIVRYIGIDTPETEECFAQKASQKNEELVLNKEVRLLKDISETDRYGRIIRYVYIGDTFVNDYLVRYGFAKAANYPPDVKYQEQFKQAEEEAKNNKRGLWADDACKTETVSNVAPVAPLTSASVPIKTNVPSTSGGSYACNCSKTCAQMSSCAEAQYQLKVCSCSKRDGDGDGIACDGDCQ